MAPVHTDYGKSDAPQSLLALAASLKERAENALYDALGREIEKHAAQYAAGHQDEIAQMAGQAVKDAIARMQVRQSQ